MRTLTRGPPRLQKPPKRRRPCHPWGAFNIWEPTNPGACLGTYGAHALMPVRSRNLPRRVTQSPNKPEGTRGLENSCLWSSSPYAPRYIPVLQLLRLCNLHEVAFGTVSPLCFIPVRLREPRKQGEVRLGRRATGRRARCGSHKISVRSVASAHVYALGSDSARTS